MRSKSRAQRLQILVGEPIPAGIDGSACLANFVGLLLILRLLATNAHKLNVFVCRLVLPFRQQGQLLVARLAAGAATRPEGGMGGFQEKMIRTL